MKKKAIQITLDETVLSTIDEFANQNGLSRSGAISVTTMSYINSMNGVQAISGLYAQLKAQEEKGEIGSKHA